MGPATVGRTGSEGRLYYSAIGNAVNLASHPCSSVENREILIESVVAEATGTSMKLVGLEPRLP